MLDKLAQGWDDVRAWNRARPKMPVWMCLLVIVVLALAVEVLGFNFRHWQSLGYEERVLRDTPVEVTAEGYSLGFSGLDTDVHNVKIEVENESKLDSSVWVQIAVTDEGNSTMYYLPVVQGHEDNARSQVHTIFTYGKLKSLRLTFPGDVYGGVDGNILVASNDFPLLVTKVSVNAQVPFAFSWLRFALLTGGMLLVWGLRPGGVCGRIHALDRSWPARAVRGGVLAVLLVGSVVFTLSFPRWFNVATTFYNVDEYNENGRLPWTALDQPDTATNEYAKLAQAFASGQLELLQTPPQWLNDMDDPYDYGARTEESSHHLRGYLWDTAYYDGSYYVYFGVLPVLVFYLPYYLLTGSTFPNAVAVLVCSLAFIVGVYALLRALVRWRFTKASLSTFVLVLLGMVFASGVMFGLARPGMYNVPVTMARALVMWGLYLWYCGWNLRSPVRLGAGSLLVALIAATRPQLLIVAPLVFVLLVLVARAPRPGAEGVRGTLPGGARAGEAAATRGALAGMRTPLALTREQKAGWAACLLVPFVVVAAGVMWYNWARFDSPFDFGASYNLTFNNMTMRGHSLLRALEGAYYYLFNPPSVTTNFPFLKLGAIYPTFSGTTIYEPLFGGLLLLEPMLLAVVFLAGLRRSRGVARADKPLFWMAGYFLVAGVVLVLFDTEGAGILLRYVQDFGFIFALSAALVFLHHLGGAGTRLADEGVWKPGELGRALGELDVRRAELASADARAHIAETHALVTPDVHAEVAKAPAGWREVLRDDAAPIGAHAETSCEATGADDARAESGADGEGAVVADAGGAHAESGADGEAGAAAGAHVGAARAAQPVASVRADAGSEDAGVSEAQPASDARASEARAEVVPAGEDAAGAPAEPEAAHRRSPWVIALFACVLIGYFTAILMGLLEHDPTGDLSTGGSYPLDWENLRQAFMWWL